MAHNKSLLLMASALVASMPQMSFAQEASTEEILITARKRAESIQDVPLSVTAFDSEQIRRRSILELEDVALLTPGLTFEDFGGGGFGVPVIRGATQQDITILEQNVSVFLDGVYLPRAYAFDLGTVGMERIEIVKGPQSALYGQNAFMGAINYVTKGPDTSEYQVNGSLTYGTDDFFEASGSVNLPIVKDQFAMRFSGAYASFDGTWENNHPLADADIPGGTSGNVGGSEQYNFGIQLLARPVEGLEITASYRKFDIEREAMATNRINVLGSGVFQEMPNCGLDLGAGPSLFCGRLPGVAGREDDFVVDPRSGGAQTETDFYSVGVAYEFSDAVTLSYNYGNISSEALQISTAREFNVLTEGAELTFQGTPQGEFDYWQHEVRVEYDEGPLRLLFGGFMSRVEDIDIFSIDLPELRFLFGGGPAPAFGTDPITTDVLGFELGNATTIVRSRSLFGLASYAFMDDKLRLTGELRYTKETKDLTNNANMSMEPRFEADFLNPRITIDYNVTRNSLIYVLAAKGTKAGGINGDPGAFGGVPLIPEEKNFDPDTNWTYEIGTKNTFMDGQLVLNAAAFYIDWSDQQISILPTTPPGVVLPDGVSSTPILANAGDVTIKGFELSGTYSPIEPLVLNFGVSYQDATFGDGVISERLLRRGFCDDIVCSSDFDIGGNTLQRSAPWQANGGFNWQDEFKVLEGVDYFVQADIAWQAQQFVSELNLATVEPRTLVNASLGLQADNWGVRIWARNLLNEEFVSNSFFIAAGATGAEYVPTMGQRRIVGISLTGNF
jgi:iron complex outermembrane receptor protein